MCDWKHVWLEDTTSSTCQEGRVWVLISHTRNQISNIQENISNIQENTLAYFHLVTKWQS